MQSRLKQLFLFIILLIPVLIFLFLKIFGTNQFSIPVYYENGVPAIQQFGCEYEQGEYTVSWPAGLDITPPALLFLSGNLNSQSGNMIRRISTIRDANVPVYILTSAAEQPVAGTNMIMLDSSAMTDLMHCSLASDTLDQWVLVDGRNRIRGYYNVSLEEQDRMMNELSILLQEK